jgi:hypothetical protein
MSAKDGLPLGCKYCTEVESLDADGQELSVGDLITYYAGGLGRPLLTGRIASLWREDHPNVSHPMYFAELEDSARMWLHRDHPRLAESLEVEFGARSEGALW